MDDIKASKLLPLVLRHDPGRIGIELDGNGWVAVPVLLSALDAHNGVWLAGSVPARYLTVLGS